MGSEQQYILVTQYFHPHKGTTGRLMTELALGLRRRGLDITVLTAQPNYHSGNNEKQPIRETVDGVPVRRIRAPHLEQKSTLHQLFNWIVFPVWMFFRLLFLRPESDTKFVFVSNPAPFPPFMWAVCRIRGWDYTYILHDLWPDKGVSFGFYPEGGLVYTVWTYFHNRSLRDAEHVVVLGEVMKSAVLDKGVISDDQKVSVIHNWADDSFIQPLPKDENWFSKEHGFDEQFTIVYSGNIGMFHELETAIRGMLQFDEDQALLVIIGGGDKKEALEALARRLGVLGRTVEFLPFQPEENLPYSITSGDATLVGIKDGFQGTCVSSKLYTSLAAGKPVLGLVPPSSDEAGIIQRNDVGEQVSPGAVDQFVEVVETWRTSPELVETQGRNARNLFESEFTKGQSIDNYYDTLTGE